MASGIRSLLRGGKGGPGGVVQHTVGNALVLHAEEAISSEAQSLALSVVEDAENDVVVLDLGAGMPIGSWESMAGVLPRRRRGIRLVACGQHRNAAAMAGQWLSERLNRTVIAPDGDLIRGSAGALFVHSAPGSGWVRFRPGKPPTWDAKRYPTPAWDRAVVDRKASSSTGEIEPLPGGVWIHDVRDPETVATHRARLVADVPCQPEVMTVLLGCPGTAPLSLDDVVRFWRELDEDSRARTRFVQYGDVRLPEGESFGQTLADQLGTNIVCYTGVPVGSPQKFEIRTVRPDGVLGWAPFALELGYAPRAHPNSKARRPHVLSHRPPLRWTEEIAKRVYWYAPDAVVEVVQSGLWIRSPEEPPNAERVRAAALDPEGSTLIFDDTVDERTARMRELAEDLAARLESSAGGGSTLFPASVLVPGMRPAGNAQASLSQEAQAPVEVAPQRAVVAPSQPVAEIVPVAEPVQVEEPVRARPPAPVQPPAPGEPVVASVPVPGPQQQIQVPLPERPQQVQVPQQVEAPVPPSAVTAPTTQLPQLSRRSELPVPPQEPAVAPIPPVPAEPSVAPAAPQAEVPAPTTPPPPVAPPPAPMAPSPALEIPQVDLPEPADVGTSKLHALAPDLPPAAPVRTPAPAERAPAAPPAVGDGVRVQAVPDPAASALLPRRPLDDERGWLRRTLSREFDTMASSVSRLMSEHPGMHGGGALTADDVLADSVAVRFYLSRRGAGVDAGLRSGGNGPHVPFARCVASGLSRLPSYRGTTLLRTSPTAREWELYRDRRLVTDWGFVAALTGPCTVQDGDTDVLIWSMTARRTTLLEPDGDERAEDRVLFLPGTSFKILDITEPAGDRRGAILMREIGANEIDDSGRVDANRVSLDELAVAALRRSAERWAGAEARRRVGPGAVARFGTLPGLVRPVAAEGSR